MSKTAAPETPSAQVPARTAENSVIVRMASRFGMDPVAFERTIKATVMPGEKPVAPEQLAAFLLVAHEYQLNPFTKQIYAFPGKGGGVVPIVSIDGWYHIMNTHPQFDGIEFEDELDDETGKVTAVTARVHRKDRSHPICVTEYLAECKRNTEPWNTWPARMLRHKAAIQAARAAFGLSGFYDPDEAERIQEAEVLAERRPAKGRGMEALANAVGASETEAEPPEAEAADREPGADEELDA